MSIKPNIEPVPNPASALREAIAIRDDLSNQMADIHAKTAIFAPIEAEVATADADLQMILQADARAMQSWAEGGATGAPPEPAHRAREAATLKVSAARAKLNATGTAKEGFQVEITQTSQKYIIANQGVKNAEREVLIHEVLRRSHAMKKAAIDYLNAETNFFQVRNAAAGAGGCDAAFAQSQEITRALTQEDEAALRIETQGRINDYIHALLRGE